MVIGMTRTALHAAAPANRAAGPALALQALSPPEREGSAEVVRTVVPAPGADSRLETQDGRTHRVSDPAALAAAIDAQDVGVRIDFDHQSEPMSPTFQGSTAAVGWARRFRAAADGSIEAVLDLSAGARRAIEAGQYRYLSPALWVDDETGEVISMSSIAILNNPNMQLAFHAADGGGGGGDPDPAARERRLAERERLLAEREAAAERQMTAAAQRSVDGGGGAPLF